MSQIKFALNEKDVLKRLGKLQSQLVGAGWAKAENRALTTMRKTTRDEYEKALGVKLKTEQANRRIRIEKASKDKSGQLHVITKPMNFSIFQPKIKKKVKVNPPKKAWGKTRIGVTVKLGTGRKLVRGFLIPNKKPVFARTGTEREPIAPRMTRKPEVHFSRQPVIDRIRGLGMQSFIKNFESEYNLRRSKILGE